MILASGRAKRLCSMRSFLCVPTEAGSDKKLWIMRLCIIPACGADVRMLLAPNFHSGWMQNARRLRKILVCALVYIITHIRWN